MLLSSHPGYFGKIGKRTFHLKKDLKYRPKIAVDKLWSLLPADTFSQFKDKKDGTAPILDVTQSVCALFPSFTTQPLMILSSYMPLHSLHSHKCITILLLHLIAASPSSLHRIPLLQSSCYTYFYHPPPSYSCDPLANFMQP